MHPLRLSLLLGLVMLLGVGASPKAAAESAEGPGVRAIEWHGVEAVSPKDLEAAILTTKASWKPWAERRPYDPGTLEQDLNRLRRFYRSKGLYESELRSEVEEQGNRVVIRIFVEEGLPVLLEELRLSLKSRGLPASPLDEGVLEAGLPLAAGASFSPEHYEQTKEILRQRLARRGYPAPSILGGAEVNLDRHAARVDWTLDPGPYVRLGVATPVGLERVAPELVLGELRWKPGDPFDPEILRKSQRAIFDLGLFRSVSIRAVPPQVASDPTRPLEEQWPVEVRVQERPPRALRGALGFGTEDRLRARLEWKHRNFFGGLRSLRIGAKYSFLERGVETVLVQPRFLDPVTRLTLDTVLSEQTDPAFDMRGVSTGWLLERPLFESWEGRIGQRFELQRVTEVEAKAPIVRVDEDESFRLVFLKLGLRRSTLDSALDPRKGSWFDLSVEPALATLGSEVSYLRTQAELRLFQDLPGELVLATRARVGTLERLDGDRVVDVPIFKRFFSGGSTSVRGFELNRLGPLDIDDEPIGGFTLAEANIELRFPLWRELRGVAFVDAGQVALDAFELRTSDFFYSTGVGMRYRTPIGPLRLDFARILNPPSGITSFRVHFSVGHAF